MTDNDPILDGITRFGLRGLPGYPTDDVVVVVPFSDLPDLLAAAREDERQRVTSDFAEYRRHMEEWQAGYNKGHAAGVEQGQRDEREKWSVLIKDRIRDLQSCTKRDDCMGKADILLVILDDYDYGVRPRGEAMRVRGDAPHDDLCPSNDGSPGPVDCDFCERLYSADARGYTRGWSAGYEQGQRDEREACIAAVEAHIRADLTEQEMFCGRKSDLIAALRAREEKP